MSESDVPVATVLLAEAFFAKGARIWLLPSVDPLVDLELRRALTALSAKSTLPTRVAVDFFVALSIGFAAEAFVAAKPLQSEAAESSA